MDEQIHVIPENMRGRIAEIMAITDRFCDEHLDAEFKELCRDMIAALIVEDCPLASGKAAGWAAGVVYSVGWVNFLGDPSQPHHMTAVDMAKAVGVSEATLMNRAKVIRQGLDLRRMAPLWATRGMLDHKPAGLDGGGQRPALRHPPVAAARAGGGGAAGDHPICATREEGPLNGRRAADEWDGQGGVVLKAVMGPGSSHFETMPIVFGLRSRL